MGFNPSVSYKLFENNKDNQTVDANITKFKTSAPKETAELQKIKSNKKLFDRLTAGKFASASTIPAVLMGFVLTKANFTAYLIDKDAPKGLLPEKYLKNKPVTQAAKADENIKADYNKLYAKNAGFTSLNSSRTLRHLKGYIKIHIDILYIIVYFKF